MLCKLEPPYVPPLSDDEPLLDVSNFDIKYTGELAAISPLRKPLSQGMEAEFERLQLEYTSPQTRDSIRESASSLCSDFSRRSSLRSSVLSNSSVSNSNADGDGDAPLLRFLSR